MFSDEEVKQVCEHSAGAIGVFEVGEKLVRVVMTKTAELLAARGGTAEDVATALSGVPDGPGGDDERAAVHRLAARVAVLEKEQNDAFDLLGRLRSVDEQYSEETKLRERLHSAEESVRELTRRAQQAEATVETLRRTIKDDRIAYRNLVTERDMLKARCATLPAAGQVLSEHVDKARAVCERLFYWLAMGDEGPESELPCPEEIAELPKPIAELLEEARVAARGLGGLKDEDENHARYPCSPTCTHDDAATPGHPERVKHRSEAVKALSEKILPGPDVIDGGPGSRGPVRVVSSGARDMAYAYAEGAEAMRAACWEAVQEWAQGRGLTREEQQSIKSAIEGATP